MPPRKKQSGKAPQKKRPSQLGKTISLQMDDMAHGGSAIGRAQNNMIFVPYVIPGEEITARIVREKGPILFGEGIQLLAASSDRVLPQCMHFGQGLCWGCQWQHMAYEAQLLIKQDVLADQLSRLGKIPDAVLENAMQATIPSPQQWGYKHQMTLMRDQDGAWGFLRQDGKTIEPMQECHIVHPDLLALYDELDLDFEQARRMTLQLGSDGGLMVILELSSEEAPELSTDMTMSVNVILPDNEPVNLIGDSYTVYSISGHDFRVTAGSYFRSNLGQIPNLIAEVLKLMNLSGNEQVLDLYGGVGLFSAFIAPYAEVVTLVESYPPAASDAEENLSQFDNVDIVEGTVEDVIESMVDESAEYDLVLLDPSAHGIDSRLPAGLKALNVRRIIYLSSDPASLARDSQELFKVGYHIVNIQPIDLAPQTYYIDSIVLFTKA